MPGTNPAEAMRVVAGELPDFPHLPELPDRGPGADLTGRTAALLVEIPVEVTPRGWRLAERPGRDLARARTMLSSDLDVMFVYDEAHHPEAGRGRWPPPWSCRARSTWPSPTPVPWPT